MSRRARLLVFAVSTLLDMLGIAALLWFGWELLDVWVIVVILAALAAGDVVLLVWALGWWGGGNAV